MCGAPVFVPAIPTRFFYYRPEAAADVTDDVGSPPPSSPSTPLETSAPPQDTLAESSASAALLSSQHKQQLVMMARGQLLAAAQQIMDRQRQAASSTKVANVMVMDAGSSTPSGCSSSSSCETTTPSPRGPLRPPSVPGLATQPPPLPFPMLPLFPPPAPHVEVRQVWAHNFEQEAKLIESLLPRFPYVAVGTEFPGNVYRPAGPTPAYALSPEERYRLLRSNVDALDLVQLGLTLFDVDDTCHLTPCVWEFNFRDSDVRRRHAPAERVAFLTRRQDGVDAAAALGPRLRRWARAGAGAGLGRGGVVTGRGGYDLAYLVKAMFGAGFRMPALAAEFEAVARAALLRGCRRRVFDVREMARLCPTDDHLRSALDGVAAELNVAAAGEARRAGYDSLLACYTFVKLREVCFDDDAKLASVDGILAEITAF